MTRAPLRIAERVLHYLAGIPTVDERLRGLVSELPAEPLPPSRAERSRPGRRRSGSPGIVPLELRRQPTRRTLAASSPEPASTLGTSAFALDASDVPEPAAERDTLARLWEREAALTGRRS